MTVQLAAHFQQCTMKKMSKDIHAERNSTSFFRTVSFFLSSAFVKKLYCTFHFNLLENVCIIQHTRQDVKKQFKCARDVSKTVDPCRTVSIPQTLWNTTAVPTSIQRFHPKRIYGHWQLDAKTCGDQNRILHRQGITWLEEITLKICDDVSNNNKR